MFISDTAAHSTTTTTTQPEAVVINEMHARARQWMADHEEVMTLFEHLAAQMAFRGRAFSIGHLTEVVRWEYGRMHPQQPGIKLCNSYRAYIARELIRRNPALATLIELRPIRQSA